MSSFKKGDKVTWNSPQGIVEGVVTQKITQDTQLAGKKFKASKDDPKIKVKSDKTEKEAIHKEGSLNR